MKACRFGIVFFGAGVTRGRNAHRTVEALLQLVTDLNDHTRFYARRMRRYGDVAGADSVLAWQTGFPFGVNLARGYPRYNPGEFTGPEMLSRGEVDCCVLVGSETVADFPPAARDHLRRIPVIVLDPPGWRRCRRRCDSRRRYTASTGPGRRTGWTRCRSRCGCCCRPTTPATAKC